MKVFLAVVLVCAAATATAETDPASGLKIAPGWEQARAHCGACHSYRLLTSQRAERNTWQAMIRWMQKTQGLWPLPEATESQLLDYLAENYPPRPNRRRAPLSPELLPRVGDAS